VARPTAEIRGAIVIDYAADVAAKVTGASAAQTDK
jgi:hypothetical protein